MTAKTSNGETVNVRLPWGAIIAGAVAVLLAVGASWSDMRDRTTTLVASHLAIKDKIESEAVATRAIMEARLDSLSVTITALTVQVKDLDERLRRVESTPRRATYEVAPKEP